MKMQSRLSVAGLALVAAGQMLGQVPLGAAGDVQLSFSTPLGAPIVVTPQPGTYVTFDVSVWLDVAPTVTGVTGLDFYLAINPAGSGLFHINAIQRLSTILVKDNTLAPAHSGLTPTAGSRLSTRNGQEEVPPDPSDPNGLLIPYGYSLSFSDGNHSVKHSDSPHEVVQFTIGVNPLTPAGTYMLTTTSNPWNGWSDTGENDPDGIPQEQPIPSQDHAAISITVIPEPGASAVAGAIGLIAFAGARRYLKRTAA